MMSAQSALPRLSFVKFLFAGGLNTVLTYGIFLLLLMAFSYTTSFTIAFMTGIVLAYVMNRFFVFDNHRGLKSIVWLPLVYVMQYLLSMIILWCWVEKLGFTVLLAPLSAIIITLPVTYFFSRYLFHQGDNL